MNEIKKKKKEVTSNKKEEISMEPVETLGEILYETSKNTDQKELEIFDQYAHLLKLKIYSSEDLFCSRLSKGYKALINEITHSTSQ
jgi:hypothetical protein